MQRQTNQKKKNKEAEDQSSQECGGQKETESPRRRVRGARSPGVGKNQGGTGERSYLRGPGGTAFEGVAEETYDVTEVRERNPMQTPEYTGACGSSRKTPGWRSPSYCSSSGNDIRSSPRWKDRWGKSR
jgi:hypothetical protein